MSNTPIGGGAGCSPAGALPVRRSAGLRMRGWLALVWLPVACSTADTAVLSPGSLGPVLFGSQLREVEARLGERAPGPANEDETGCRFVTFAAFPQVHFMVEDGIVTRANVSAEVANSLGVTVGTRMQDVVESHPAVQLQPHKYDPDGYYLIFGSVDHKAAIVMEVGNGRVTRIRAGLEPSVEYVEGCL